MVEEYKFRDVAEKCNSCEREFKEDLDLFSALSKGEESYERLDFCVKCWERREGGEILCFWKRKPRVKEGQPTVSEAVIFDIFQKLDGSTDRHDQNFRYILGLLLMRRKRLKFITVENAAEGELLIMEDRRIVDAKYRLLDPGMSEEEMQGAKDEVGKLFAMNVDDEESSEEKEEGDGARDGQSVSEVHQP